MLDSFNLTSIILAELLFVAVLVAGLLALALRQVRKQHRKLLLAYEKLRHQRAPPNALETAPETQGAQSSPADPVAEHLKRQKASAQERYHTITGAKLPRLSASQDLGANLAALRYFYCRAEEQAYRKQQTLGNLWVTLEKELNDILQWVSNRQGEEQVQRKNRELELLQNQARNLRLRIKKLEPYKTDTARLERKLALSKLKQEELQQQQLENQKTIEKLRRINRDLSLSAGQSDQSPSRMRKNLQNIQLDDADFDSHHRLTKITQFASDNQRLGNELTRGFRDYTDTYPNPREKQLKETIGRLEAELYHSQRHIEALTKDSQKTGKASSSHNLFTPAPDAQSEPLAKADKIEDTLKVIHSDLSDSATNLFQGRDESAGPNHSLVEIRQMHYNNQRQRQLIVELEKDLKDLEKSLPEVKDKTEHERQTKELERLQRLLQESEHCIVALESQVDMLFNQLQEREALASGNQRDAGTMTQDSLVQMEHELEVMSERLQDTLLRSWQSQLIRQFALQSLEARTPEQLARQLVQLFRKAELALGFALKSDTMGSPGYFPGKRFTHEERRLVYRSESSSETASLNEGILLSSKHINILLKDPPDDDRELIHTEELLNAICILGSARVEAMELDRASGQHEQTLKSWTQEAHKGLLNLDIAYAYEAEETMRLVDACARQVREASQWQNISEGTKMVIENALQECESQIKQLFNRPDSVDRNCEALMQHLDELPGASP